MNPEGTTTRRPERAPRFTSQEWAAQAPDEPDTRTEAAVRQLLVDHLLAESPVAELMHILLALVVGVLLWPDVPRGQLLWWLGLVAGAAVLRAALRVRFSTVKASRRRILISMRMVVWAGGLAWAVGPAVILAGLPLESLALLMVVFAGLVAGGTSTLLADSRTFYGFAIAILAPTVVAILASGQSRVHIIAIVLLVLFAVTMLVVFRHAHARLVNLLLSESDAKRRRHFLQALLTGAPNAIAIVADDGEVLAINPAFERVFGYTTSEAVGSDINSLTVPDFELEAARRMDREARAGTVLVAEIQRKKKDGALIWVQASASLVGEEERHTTLFIQYQDITERIRTNEELRKLSRAVEESPATVIITDSSGIIEYVNPRFTEVAGYSAEEAIGCNPRDLLGGGMQSKEFYDEIWDTVLAGKQWRGEFKNRKKDGEVFWELASISPIKTPEGVVTRVVMVKEDISVQKQVARELEAAKLAAEAAAEAKSAFLANMSHEIRTPMNGVIGMLELIRDSELDENQRQSVEIAASSAESLLTVINDILDISKIEAGQLELEEIPFDLEKTATSAIRVLMVPATKRGNEVNIEVSPELPQSMLGDPGRVRQVITNLLGNAIKFTSNGDIIVHVGVVERLDGVTRVRISVKDTGIGVPAERVGSIFDEFSQADASTRRLHGGTGLGLSISKRIVEQMGGTIEVESSVGVGSEFRFEIPLRDGPSEIRTDRGALGDRRFEGRRFLVVDDNETARRIVRQALASVGGSVDEADNVDGALELIAEAALASTLYDAVIIDSMMPRRDGFSLAAAVQGNPDLAGLRMMMLTSAGEFEGRRKAREHDIRGYMTKPVTRMDLIEALHALLGLRGPGEGPERRLITEDSLVKDRPQATVLLAEDNTVNQKIAVTILSKRGHHVDVAENGLEAINKVRERDYDVVLMDIQMPELDGLSATREIRGLGYHDLPIVALTAHALAEERERCAEAGMNAFLSKPFKPHDLAEAVERWVRPPGVDPRRTDKTPEDDLRSQSPNS